MKETRLPYCDLIFKETHAIIVMNEGSEITVAIGEEITSSLEAHYKGRNFVFITHRKFPHKIDLKVYEGRILKNMIGYAIVSDDPAEVNRAVEERPLWDQAFTFFRELEEAENWARSFFD
ncbi:hypothetical protein GCM10022393_36970 [Aquimarina addita]|uniref:STAS/SEC14 domain-containing protein n=1 Tax=Aquimarina addita TaxID=870485 RepID=A0ABP6UVJ7_9FLAO